MAAVGYSHFEDAFGPSQGNHPLAPQTIAPRDTTWLNIASASTDSPPELTTSPAISGTSEPSEAWNYLLEPTQDSTWKPEQPHLDFTWEPERLQPIVVDPAVAPAPKPRQQHKSGRRPVEGSGDKESELIDAEEPPATKKRSLRQRPSANQAGKAKPKSTQDKVRARNRAAAHKFRQKKKDHVDGLEKEKSDLENRHHKLVEECAGLQDELHQVKVLLMAHGDCNDKNIDAWMKAQAHRFIIKGDSGSLQGS